jgi:hypothetical protein
MTQGYVRLKESMQSNTFFEIELRHPRQLLSLAPYPPFTSRGIFSEEGSIQRDSVWLKYGKATSDQNTNG